MSAVKRWCLNVDAERGVLEGHIRDHSIPEYNVGAGEGWPVVVHGSYEMLQSLQADLQTCGHRTELCVRTR